jgi:acetyl-CoA synthetase
MRRILRKIAEEKPEELGDTSTLSDPSVVDEILQLHNLSKEQKTA